jgi:hypothetical protein
MDDETAKENPPADFNKIDLSQLQGFSFGTQWTQDKSSGPERRSRGADRPPREERGDDGPRGPAPNRRDRRSFQRPVEGSHGPSGGDSRPSQPDAGPRGEAYPRRRGPVYEPPPYLSPYFSVVFYPEDASFTALVKTVRASCRTIELFEIARTVLAKPERFTVVVARRGPEPTDPAAAPQPGPPVAISVPDGLPFESEEAAISHVLRVHLGLFFDQAEATIDPPKGNFPVINRCTITGELLGPPNYHLYNQTVQRHHAERIGRLSLEDYRGRIESVRDPALVEQWLEKMKKVTRYTWKQAPVAAPAAPPAPPAEPAPAEAPAAEAAQAPADAGAGAGPAPAAEPAAPAGPPAPSFDTLEEARAHLISHARDRVVRTAAHARFPGRAVEQLPDGEIRRAVEGALERQRRFPLDTANTLRGRLRREHFTIFKKGAKGVSYVCSVKRKFRVPGQVFSDSIGALIGFIEANAMVKASELAERFLGLGQLAPDAVPTPEQREKIARMQGDLHWLVHEGYVTEFIDGTLYAPPPVAESRKREIESEEQDPEAFPEAAASEPAPADSAPVEQAPAEPPAPAAEPAPEPAVPIEPPAAELPGS